MKKITFLVLGLLLCFGMYGCESNDEQTKVEEVKEFNGLNIANITEYAKKGDLYSNYSLEVTEKLENRPNDFRLTYTFSDKDNVMQCTSMFDFALSDNLLTGIYGSPADKTCYNQAVEIAYAPEILGNDASDLTHLEKHAQSYGNFRLAIQSKDDSSSFAIFMSDRIETKRGGSDSKSSDETVDTESKNALDKAESYLKRGSGFSKKRLREQLKYEKFENSAIDYAMKNVNVNYDEQCLRKAESYQKSSSMSKERLKEQLDYEGFTSSQIDYAMKHIK